MTRSSLTFELHRTIGFRTWKEQPFAHSYLGIDGPKGQFLGFWAVLMQASFSFFGSEVPGIVCLILFAHKHILTSAWQAAGEVIDATRVMRHLSLCALVVI